MADSYFLQLSGIKGESADSKHKDEIELVSFSWGIVNSGSGHVGGGAGSGKVTFADFEVAMPVNRASPQLFIKGASGSHIPSGLLSVRRSGKEQVEYLKFKFTDLVITSYEESGNAGGDERPMDVVRFNAAKFEMTYTTIGSKGAGGTSETVGWNLAQNTKS